MAAKITDLCAHLISRSRRSSGGCIEWQGAKTRGYGVLRVGDRNVLAHRLAWMLYKGDIPDGYHVCHHCDNPPCLNVDHLFLGTDADNVADKIAKGRMRWGNWPHKGELSPTSKLTEIQARSILRAEGRIKDIAIRFGISRQAVSDIKHGRRWRHLHGDRA